MTQCSYLDLFEISTGRLVCRVSSIKRNDGEHLMWIDEEDKAGDETPEDGACRVEVAGLDQNGDEVRETITMRRSTPDMLRASIVQDLREQSDRASGIIIDGLMNDRDLDYRRLGIRARTLADIAREIESGECGMGES
jgi:hypothetical protein